MKYPVLVFNDGKKFVARCLMVDSIRAQGSDLAAVLKDIENQLFLRVCDDEAEIIILVEKKDETLKLSAPEEI